MRKASAPTAWGPHSRRIEASDFESNLGSRVGATSENQLGLRV